MAGAFVFPPKRREPRGKAQPPMTGNTFEIADVVAVSLALMRSNSVLGECVTRDAEAAFTGGRGDSVRVRTPKRRADPRTGG